MVKKIENLIILKSVNCYLSEDNMTYIINQNKGSYEDSDGIHLLDIEIEDWFGMLDEMDNKIVFERLNELKSKHQDNPNIIDFILETEEKHKK